MKNKSKFFGIIAIIAVIGLSMAACDQSNDPAPAPAPAPGPTPAPDPGPQQPASPNVNGNWIRGNNRLNFDNGYWYRFYNAAMYMNGRFSISGNNITIVHTHTGGSAVANVQQTGIVSATAQTLSLTIGAPFNGWTGTWQRQQQ